MRYPGGKGGLYRRIIRLMPPHDVFIETHLGGGAVIRHKKPADRNIGIEVDPIVLAGWPAEEYPHVELVNDEAVSYLEKFQFAGSELVYCDPPYLASTRKRERVYRCDYAEKDHIRLIEVLRRLPCAVLISGYESGLYNELLSGWTKITFTAASHTGLRTEIAWMNYTPPEVPHDLSFIGNTFREREQTKRRHMRLRSRIERLSGAEKALLGEWFARTYPELIPASVGAGDA